MKNKNQKIFVFDVGNTLIEKPSNCMVQTLADDLIALQENGNIIGVATMRNIAMLNELLIQVKFDFIIALNGAYVECENQIIIDSPIKNNELTEILKVIDKNKIECKLYTKHEIQTSIRQIETVYGIELRECSEVIDTLKKEFPSFVFHVWEKGKTCDIHSIDVSKSIGMQKVCHFFDIPSQMSTAFGDGFNDIGLFKLCGISVAMGSSPQELKRLATFVTKSVEDNGVSWALKNFIL